VALPSPESLPEKTEKVLTVIEWLADVIRSRNWVRKLVLVDVLLFFLLVSLPGLAPYVGLELPKPYLVFGGAIIALVFIAAVLVALRTVPPRGGAVAPDPAARSAIKGLRPFGFDDAPLFTRLQRDVLVRECVEALTDPEFRFGILCGPSGCGKTSFLQAGLWPRLTAPDASHRGVYVKCSDLDPLESIRQALTEQLHLPQAAGESVDLLMLLATAAQVATKPLVLLLDQFEQFFVQRKRKEDREPCVRALAAWYRTQPPLPVKIAVCIRGDMSDRLIELQKTMEYTLGPQHIFHLEPFAPHEATEVFRVIAEAEKLTFDVQFMEELVVHELADREDGLVSPVDVQVLAWMVKAQKISEERGFTRRAYQKLGGTEGLLDQFLARALGARETPARREAALKVLLALTDLEHNARAGVLTIEQLQEKLAGTVASGDVQEAGAWLARGDVRLVTPITRDGTQGYELAHERLIPALRRLAGRELSSADRANQLLERRVNEWLGNDCSVRYLLTWRELRTIERQRPYIVWGAKQPLKERLLAYSRQRRRVRIAGASLLVILPLMVLAGWYSPWGQMWQVKRELFRLSNKLREVSVLAETARAFAKDGDIQRALHVAQRIPDSSSQGEILRYIVMAAWRINDPTQAQKWLQYVDEAMRGIEGLDADDRAWTFSTLAQVAAKSGNNTQAKVYLDRAVATVPRKTKAWTEALLFYSIAEAAVEIGDPVRAKASMERSREAAPQLQSLASEASLFAAMAELAAKSSDNAWAKAYLDRAIGRLHTGAAAELPVWLLTTLLETTAQIGDAPQIQMLLERAREAVPQLREAETQTQLLHAMAEAVAKISGPAQVQEWLKHVAEAALWTESLDAQAQFSSLFAAAEAAAKSGYNAEAKVYLELAIEKLHTGAAAELPVWLLTTLMGTAAQIGDAPQIQMLLERAREAVPQLATMEPKDRASLFSAMAEAAMKIGDSAQAKAYLEHAREAALKVKRSEDRASLFGTMAQVAAKSGDNVRAKAYLERAAETVPDARTLEAIIGAAATWGYWRQARAMAEQSTNDADRARMLATVLNIWGQRKAWRGNTSEQSNSRVDLNPALTLWRHCQINGPCWRGLHPAA
jgi:hypothetical protein